MFVCDKCLMGIEAHEGSIFSRRLDYKDWDLADEEDLYTCEWCEEKFDRAEMNEI